MPIFERDAWRLQYFSGVSCPDSVRIPTDDVDAWPWYPQHRWIYDKLKMAESQGMACGPHGVKPPSFPVFSKPVINLKGMGLDSRRIDTAEDLERHSTAGHFWMPLLEGEHVSTDCAVADGTVRWLRHATGLAWKDGMFRYWIIAAEAKPDLAANLSSWVSRNMAGYTGMMNFETIGGRIIEAHLRFADQWPDIYGDGWVDALVRLYAEGHWHFPGEERRTGFSVPLFARHDGIYRHPTSAQQMEIRSMPGISSLQITFHEHRPEGEHPMPPGGFRLGVINCWSLEAGLAARERLATFFPGAGVILPE